MVSVCPSVCGGKKRSWLFLETLLVKNLSDFTWCDDLCPLFGDLDKIARSRGYCEAKSAGCTEWNIC